MSRIFEIDLRNLYQLNTPLKNRPENWNNPIVHYMSQDILIPFIQRSRMAEWGANLPSYQKFRIPISIRLVECTRVPGVPAYKYIFSLLENSRYRCNIYSSDIPHRMFDNYEECAKECEYNNRNEFSPFESTRQRIDQWIISWKYYEKRYLID